MNDLPPAINSHSKPVLFDSDIIIIISHPDIGCFQNCMNEIFASLNKGIKANKLTLNFDKTSFMKCCTNKQILF
jgi:hypothetical protein